MNDLLMLTQVPSLVVNQRHELKLTVRVILQRVPLPDLNRADISGMYMSNFPFAVLGIALDEIPFAPQNVVRLGVIDMLMPADA